MPEAPNLDFARAMCSFIDASPTPFHVVESAAKTLTANGFGEVDEVSAWPEPGRHFVRRGGALVAWIDSDTEPVDGFVIVGAHSDSPNLRIKPQPDTGKAGFKQLGVEVYGGVLLNSWLDRDLAVAGRVFIRDGHSTCERLILVDRPVVRLPQLAIHLDRGVNDGLKLNPQTHMSPVWGLGMATPGAFAAFLADEIGIESGDLISWDLMLHDTMPSALTGPDLEFVSAPRLDNQLSCFVAIESLVSVSDNARAAIPMVALFDHEEVGSASATGATSPMLRSIIERSVLAREGDAEAVHRALAASLVISCDNAHATHPNYADRHEPDHQIALNGGPVIKINANERYATEAATAAAFQLACEHADVPFQKFVNRTDLACGSTIGPLTAAALGVAAVDVGCPQLAMHSIRELAGSHDPGYLHAALNTLWSLTEL
ncbi:MAG: M18 family aminopeptidase [Acidimicrobiales bacterium]